MPSCSQGWLTCATLYQDQLHCAAWVRHRVCSPEWCIWWEVGPFFQNATVSDMHGLGAVLYSLWTSTWSQAAAQTRDIPMVSSGNLSHTLTPTPPRKYPQTQTWWPSAAAWLGLHLRWQGWLFIRSYSSTLESPVPCLFIMLKLLHFSFPAICPPHISTL